MPLELPKTYRSSANWPRGAGRHWSCARDWHCRRPVPSPRR
ncbi:hypothetical protein M5D96_012826 [Drosophila gunungcola]|uniref:Uncharacterized protein n=1 Tax=Drosophila gunungcola TaxID=103775 RepID=A0A9P9YCM3_9MUSC|nr:hypothetical protein M5D96_012826 [Drosophila gunungcola]